jgi:hypothetical protein
MNLQSVILDIKTEKIRQIEMSTGSGCKPPLFRLRQMLDPAAANQIGNIWMALVPRPGTLR